MGSLFALARSRLLSRPARRFCSITPHFMPGFYTKILAVNWQCTSTQKTEMMRLLASCPSLALQPTVTVPYPLLPAIGCSLPINLQLGERLSWSIPLLSL